MKIGLICAFATILAFNINMPRTETVVKNANGNIIGFISSDNKVYDKNRRYIGKSDSSGTYDERNRKILMNNLPAFLLGREVGKNF